MNAFASLLLSFIALAIVEAGQIRGTKRIHRQIPHRRDLGVGTTRTGDFKRDTSFIAKHSRQVDGDEEDVVVEETRFPKGDFDFQTEAPVSKGEEKEDEAEVAESVDDEETEKDDVEKDDGGDKDDGEKDDKVDEKDDDSDDETYAPTSAPTKQKLVKAVSRPDGKLPGKKGEKMQGPFAPSSSKSKKSKKPKVSDSKDAKKMNKYDVRGFKKGIRRRNR
ncbi:MAG: hypothetical protein SGARI_006156, partial [Bacillariaceae sp.]